MSADVEHEAWLRSRCNECGRPINEHPTLTPHRDGEVYLCPTVPRIARSLTDLRPGMWVSVRQVDAERWRTFHLTPLNTVPINWATDEFENGGVVILSEPAPEPVPIPAELIDTLRDKFIRMDECGCGAESDHHDGIVESARAVVDAAGDER